MYLNSWLYGVLAAQEQQAQAKGKELGKGAAELQLPSHHESLDNGLYGIPIAGAGEHQAQAECSKASNVNLDICVCHQRHQQLLQDSGMASVLACVSVVASGKGPVKQRDRVQLDDCHSK